MADTTSDRMSNEELQDLLITLFGRLPEPDLTKDNTALLCIDVQYMDAHPDYGLGARAQELGLNDKLSYFWSRIDEVRRLGFDETFVRMWDFYLATCSAAFAAGHTRDVQVLLEHVGEATAPSDQVIAAGAVS